MEQDNVGQLVFEEEPLNQHFPEIIPNSELFTCKNYLPNLISNNVVISSFKSQDDLDYILHLKQNNQNIIAAATSNRQIKIYDAESLSFNAVINSDTQIFHNDMITDLTFIPSNTNIIASCSEDGYLYLTDIRTSKVVASYREPHGKSFYACASNDQIIAAGGESSPESGICFWDLRQSKLLGAFNEVSQMDICQLQFSPTDQTRLFSGGEDGVIIEFNMQASDPDEAMESAINTEQSVRKFGFCANGDYLYCISQISTLSFWNNESGECISRCSLNTLQETMAVDFMIDCFEHDSKLYIVSGSNKGTVMLSYVSHDMPPVRVLSGIHDAPVRSILWNHNGSLYTCGEDAKIGLWSANNNNTNQSNYSLAFQSRSKYSPF